MKKKVLNLFFATASILAISACSTFEGVATYPGEAYTTTYNMPAERIVPYNNPYQVRGELKRVEICEGLIRADGKLTCEQ